MNGFEGFDEVLGGTGRLTHVANTEIGAFDVFVETTSDRNARRKEVSNQFRSVDGRREFDGREGIGSKLRLSNQVKTHCTETRAESRSSAMVFVYPSGNAAVGEDMVLEGFVKRNDRLDGRRRKVAGFAMPIRSHDGSPMSKRSIIAGNVGNSVLNNRESVRAEHGNQQAGWNAESLLRARERNVNIGRRHVQFFAANTAHTVDSNDSFGRETFDNFCILRNRRRNACRSVDMGTGK